MSPRFEVTVTCKNASMFWPIDVDAVIGCDMDGDSLYLESATFSDTGEELTKEDIDFMEVELAAIQKLEDEAVSYFERINER